MRRLVLLCSAFPFSARRAPPRRKRDPPAKRKAAKPSAAKKTEAAKAAAPDTRPRFKRDDTPAPVVVAPAKPAVAAKRRITRKPADGAPQPTGTRATPRDVAACAQARDHDAAVAGCTRIIEDGKQTPRGRAAAHYNRGNAYAAKGDRPPPWRTTTRRSGLSRRTRLP